MLFYSFKSLIGKDVVVELKNDLSGTLYSVDQYLNIKLADISITDSEKYPHMIFIGKKLLHPWICGTICATSSGRNR
ncbi:hypothetical protein CAJAP_09046 [Camponotus japonicus]